MRYNPAWAGWLRRNIPGQSQQRNEPGAGRERAHRGNEAPQESDTHPEVREKQAKC